MNDHPISDAGQPASTGHSSAPDLAALRHQHPGWHVRRGTDADPLGYSASREGTLITAPSLARLADRLAAADPPADEAAGPGALMIGRPGWNSGAMPDMTAADLAAAVGPRGWTVAEHGGHLTAEYRIGSMLRVLAGRSPAELAVRIADAEAAMPGPDPAGLLAEIAAGHPSWAVDAAPGGHGVEAVRADVHLWAHSAAELGALLDVADPMVP